MNKILFSGEELDAKIDSFLKRKTLEIKQREFSEDIHPSDTVDAMLRKGLARPA